jgi:hypothetical protein
VRGTERFHVLETYSAPFSEVESRRVVTLAHS